MKLIPQPTGPWVNHRACTPADTDLFFSAAPADIDKATKICHGCPVITECADYAIDNYCNDGIWGGTTAAQRATIRRRNRRLAS